MSTQAVSLARAAPYGASALSCRVGPRRTQALRRGAVQVRNCVADFKKAQHVVAQTAAGITASILLTSAPAALAEVQSGAYSDPKHPGCARDIAIEGTLAKVTGEDGTPGCAPGAFSKAWALEGTVDGDTILVDFSPKGGPKNLKGLWDGTGIKWPDGNKWTLEQ